MKVLNWDEGKKVVPARLKSTWDTLSWEDKHEVISDILEDLGFYVLDWNDAIFVFDGGKMYITANFAKPYNLQFSYTIRVYKDGVGMKKRKVVGEHGLRHWLNVPSEIRRCWSTGEWITDGGSASP